MSYYAPLAGMTDPENHFEDGSIGGYPIIKKVIVNVNTNKYTAIVDPFEANKNDPHQILEGWGDREPTTDFDVGASL
jgi:hypothetical protein